MISKLPLSIDDLLRQRTVEGERIEYKAGWNPDAVVRTLCAFANDFENLGGGYVVVGQDCDEDGRPVFPPAGLEEGRLDAIQRELLAACNQIHPPYFPILSVEKYEGRNLIVLWAPGGMNRPYKAPRAVTAKTKEHRYFIRRYSSTIEVKSNGEDERELLRLTATVPFDDRRCVSADVDDLRPGLIRAYLKEVGSELHEEAAGMPLVELGRRINIVDGADEFARPRNVGVVFFHDEPRKFLPGAQIDVVIFPDGPGGDPDADRVYSHFPKVVFVVDCESHIILSAATGRGPGSDLVQFRRAFVRAIGRARIGTRLADADFDAEWVHEVVRSRGVRTIVPPTRGRPPEKPPAGRWRRVMKTRFAGLKRKYGQRWQVETVNSMIKRHLGSALCADQAVPVP